MRKIDTSALYLTGVNLPKGKQSELADNLSKIQKFEKEYLAPRRKYIHEKMGQAGQQAFIAEIYSREVDESLPLLKKEYPHLDAVLKDIGYDQYSSLQKTLFDRQYLEDLAGYFAYLHAINHRSESANLWRKGLGRMSNQTLRQCLEDYNVQNKRSVHLVGNYIGNMGKKKLAILVEQIKQSKYLDLGENEIASMTDNNFSLLIRSIGNVRSLGFSINQVGDVSKERMRILAPLLRKLKYIDLNNNGIGYMDEERFKILFDALKGVRYINLGSNEIQSRQEARIKKHLAGAQINLKDIEEA